MSDSPFGGSWDSGIDTSGLADASAERSNVWKSPDYCAPDPDLSPIAIFPYRNYLQLVHDSPLSEDEQEKDEQKDDLELVDTSGYPPGSTPLVEGGADAELQRLEWQTQLAKTEEEIATLRSVLQSKLKQAAELKRLLGIGVVSELKQELSSGLSSITQSEAFQKTKDGLSQVGEKTSSVFSSVSRRLGDVRNSETFKSLETRISGVKNRMTGSQSEQNFEEALREATEALEAEKAAKGEVSPQQQY